MQLVDGFNRNITYPSGCRSRTIATIAAIIAAMNTTLIPVEMKCYHTKRLQRLCACLANLM